MKFSEVPFHESVKERLRLMADTGRIPHALLLEGPEGSGKFALARAFAQYIHCTNKTENGDSCGKCASCIQHQNFNHIDVFYTFPVLKKSGKPTLSRDYMSSFKQFLNDSPYNDIGIWLEMLGNANGQPAIYVEEVSELVSRMNVTARQSRYKIVIVWLAERLREEAANKMLKLLEEPTDDTLFILTANNPAEILPTIYSRVQRVTVKRYSDAEAASILERSYSISDSLADEMASLSDGNINAALRCAEPEKNGSASLDLFMSLMRFAWMRKVGELRKWSNDVAVLGREGSARFYEYCAHMIRENFVMNLGCPTLNSMSADEQSFSSKFSPYINSANVEDIFKTLISARNDTLANGNSRIIAFDLAVKMILLIKRAV